MPDDYTNLKTREVNGTDDSDLQAGSTFKAKAHERASPGEGVIGASEIVADKQGYQQGGNGESMLPSGNQAWQEDGKVAGNIDDST
jgi:hypothetical protein